MAYRHGSIFTDDEAHTTGAGSNDTREIIFIQAHRSLSLILHLDEKDVATKGGDSVILCVILSFVRAHLERAGSRSIGTSVSARKHKER